jgi:hypothetical protein
MIQDRWTGQIVFAATDRNYSRQLGLNNSAIMEISDALLSDSTFNWRITADANDTCEAPDPDAGCELVRQSYNVHKTTRLPPYSILISPVPVLTSLSLQQWSPSL